MNSFFKIINDLFIIFFNYYLIIYNFFVFIRMSLMSIIITRVKSKNRYINYILYMDKKKIIFIALSVLICILVYAPTPKGIDPEEFHPK